MAGSLGRLAMVAAPLLLMATMLLGSIVAAGYYEYATFGIPDDALIVPTAAPGTPTPEPTPGHSQPQGGITRHPPTATPDA